MCGFVGALSKSPTITRDLLYRMNNALLHRGPDESGIVVGQTATWGVGHRRLCVLDIDGGKQPMSLRDRGVTLLFNGEIYDHDRLRRELEQKGHVFASRSDTEVLLRLYAEYGMGLFPHLRGEFSFAIIDTQKQRAFLARDRMGLKPLFFTKTSDSLFFASEVKALFRAPNVRREFDAVSLVGAIAVSDTPGTTVFQGVHQVPNASYIEVRLDTLETSVQSYWDVLSNARGDLPTQFAEQRELVKSEVQKAIDLRLRADVPVGAYLSGGLDSSLVTAEMARRLPSIDAFALSFEESARHDEYAYAEQVAQKLGNVRLHKIPITYREMVRRLPETVWHLERPFGNLHSVAKLICAKYARNHVVCVLTGDGGDELFCGYSTAWLQQTLQQANYNHRAVAAELKRMRDEAWKVGGNRYYLQGGLAKRYSADAKKLTERLGFPPCDMATSMDVVANLRRFLQPDFREKLTTHPTLRLADHLSKRVRSASHLPHAMLLQYAQLNSSVPEYIAPIADRTEWSGSIEARPPLFDHKLAELAFALPISAKLDGDREKHVLREAFRDVLPTSVIERRKQAFLAPPAPFSGADGKALLDRYLNPTAIRNAGIWDPLKVTFVKAARRIRPRNPIINTLLTVMLTTQILQEQYIEMRT